MKAIILKDFGGIDQLEERDISVPIIQSGEVLVKKSCCQYQSNRCKEPEGNGRGSGLEKRQPHDTGLGHCRRCG